MIRRFQARIQSAKLLALVPLLASAVACNVRYSNAAFHLPSDGNPERGRAAFAELGCHGCHQVAGVKLPNSDLLPAPIVLGGMVDRKMTDAYLVTHVLDPASRAPVSAEMRMMNVGQAKMPGYADRITVRQLTDIVAFLQTNYKLRPLPPETWTH